MVGHVTVQELDWSNPNHYSTVNPPFDYVLAADCVYHEQIVEDFLRTVLAVTHSKSTGLFLFLAFAPVSLSRLRSFCISTFSADRYMLAGPMPISLGHCSCNPRFQPSLSSQPAEQRLDIGSLVSRRILAVQYKYQFSILLLFLGYEVCTLQLLW